MKIAVAWGTRPCWLKTESVIEALNEHEGVEVLEFCSGQSRDLVSEADWDRHRLTWGGSLTENVAECAAVFDHYLGHQEPAAVIVQGDTATAFACAQAAWLRGVPVAHVEAGLRTYEREPFPEEGFRRMIGAMATYHFCPDEIAKENLQRELDRPLDRWTPADAGIYIVGNTIIDILPKQPFRVLVTLHRRENWGEPLTGAIAALCDFVLSNPDGVWVYIVKHPNWDNPANLGDRQLPTVDLGLKEDPHRSLLMYLNPMDHDFFLQQLRQADVVVTDSGGLQEEAAHHGVPCLVLRHATERVALLQSGAVELVDPDTPAELQETLRAILSRRRAYGDGTAGRQIAEILIRELHDA